MTNIYITKLSLLLAVLISYAHSMEDKYQGNPSNSLSLSSSEEWSVRIDMDFLLAQDLYTKSFSFSTPTLNSKQASVCLITGKIGEKSINRAIILELFIQKAQQGCAIAQEKLYAFLTKKIGDCDVRNPEHAKALLERAVAQSKLWACKEYAKQQYEKGNKEEAKRVFLISANLGDDESAKNYEKIAGITPVKIPEMTRSWLKELNKAVGARIKLFSSTYYAHGLFELALTIESHDHLYREALTAAANLGHFKAQEVLITYFKNKRDNNSANEWLKKVTKQTSKPIHQYNLATQYWNGFKGKKPNQKNALKYFLLAAEQDQVEAMFQAGWLYLHGFEGQNADKNKAFELYTTAALKGNNLALQNAIGLRKEGVEIYPIDQRQLLKHRPRLSTREQLETHYNAVWLLMTDISGQPTDKKQALEVSLQAADQGIAVAQLNAALLLKLGFEGQPADKKRALQLYLHAAAQGMAEAQCHAAFLLEMGFEGQPVDKKRALQLYLQVANQGVPEAQFNAAILLEEGFEDRTADKEQALNLFLQAANQGLCQAQIRAAQLLYFGFKGRPADQKQALKFFLQAAEQGNEIAQYNLGCIFCDGLAGQSVNKEQALKFFLQAATQGFCQAQFNAAALLYQGFDNQPADKKQAFKLFLMAAKQGHKVAQTNVGHMFYDGFEGHSSNKNKALDFYLHAAQQSHLPAIEKIINYYIHAVFKEGIPLKEIIFWLEKAKSLKSLYAERLDAFFTEPRGQNPTTGNDEKDEEILDLMTTTVDPIVTEPEFLQVKPGSVSDEVKEEALDECEEAVPNLDQFIIADKDFSDEPNFNEFPTSQPLSLERKVSNAKYVREQMKLLGQLKKEQHAKADQSHSLPEQQIATRNEKCLNAILEGKISEIDHKDLKALFDDPLFDGQVLLYPTKNGLMITAHNRSTQVSMTVSTHKTHSRDNKGVNRHFLRDLKSLLAIFGLK